MFDDLDHSRDVACGGSPIPAAGNEMSLSLGDNRTGCHVLPCLDAPVKRPLADLRAASQLQLFYVSSWEDPPGPNDPRVSTVEQGEWSQVGTAAERDAAVHTPSLRQGSRGRTSSKTAMGHRTLQDIGIARVFSLIQTLVLASEQHRAMVRKLIVAWQMEGLSTARRSTILRFVLYYRQNHKNEASQEPGTRIRFMKGTVDVAETIKTYLNARRGICARQLIRNKVKAIVQPQLSDDLRLLDLDVEPYHQWLDIDTTGDPTGPSRNHVQWIASRIAEGRGHSR
ncbi:predicted protein [Aspergillus terreus NIH2624]|uniref:Uncharacterized protein n=1 Tax=Aspergillus terreus (strain NIH 2624 / FGSC A1156) TaxID=341663 RepID=Q0CRS1_ASPTN|nr:uncharacterized protein ATEG_03613 [Aspergillus terreus NIH2624]EAU35415.1 predicted protein [Aspergillus terreus NIH2624]